jgi:FkbM family methyltransferase
MKPAKSPLPKKPTPLSKHWERTKRSLGRRWREWMLPRGYARLGTRYGGWWVDTQAIGVPALLIDAGLGEDISFPGAFLQRFAGSRVIGVEPNPRSLAYCRKHPLAGMEILEQAFWTHAGDTLTFHLPRAQEALPKGADGVSGSLVGSHEYVEGGETLTVHTVDLAAVLAYAGSKQCDVLKLDIEGAEYAVLKQLCDNGDIRLARQVLIEFHHRVTHHSLAETEAIAALVAGCGFRLIHTEGRNYIFRRAD